MGKRKVNFARRLLADVNGSFSLMWAVSMTGILVSIGATYDLSQLTKAKAIAQYTADNMALSASVAVDTNNDDKYQAYPVTYGFEAIGAPGADFTGTMRGSVQYDITDSADNGKLLARATVSGTYQTAFLGLIPRFNEIEFQATADVAYAARQGTPASIFFVVDNSGSMEWDDDDGSEKLGSLKTSMQSFMTTLDEINNAGNNTFRTALWPYSQDYNDDFNDIDVDGIIPAHVVDPDWGVLNNGNITQMQTKYGTDSSGAMENAATAFTLEADIHQAENGEDKPIKFMIFMSDGSNNQSSECSTTSVWVAAHDEYWVDTYNGWNDVYTSEQGWFDSWVIYYPATDGEYKDQETCSTDYWADIQTKASCDAMKADGVIIYTIGYDLEEGYQYTDGVRYQQWSNWYWDWIDYWTPQSEVDRAQSLLSYCATDADHYILAKGATDLNTAFIEIGKEVVTEVIRVKH